MMNQIVNGIMPAVVKAVIIIVGAAITTVSGIAVSYLQKKKAEVVQKYGADKYNHERSIALDVYYFVEQHFKGVKNVADSKLQMFNNELLKRLPYLTPEEIANFRESICGQINMQVKNAELLDPAKTINVTNIAPIQETKQRPVETPDNTQTDNVSNSTANQAVGQQPDPAITLSTPASEQQ